ncbi:NAD(P)/FAD-dependent oxidoreductase [Falsiroseomonas oryziterrae]|uniref:NAD(P)/FAD-dependent oxidoreductase n=1 Tax=Falsiroseomonas oryziterrae TaxID=2911368 RepID=UPI001F17766C|nr:FAD-binding oxidoreductase [Roseomonas sp. NPKOSM-4]
MAGDSSADHVARERADYVVIGGGLAGCAVAYHLARDGGADVLLLERGELNAAASGNNSGSFHAQIPVEPFLNQGEGWARRFAPTLHLMMAGIARWMELPAELAAPELEVTAKGGLMVARRPAELAMLRRKSAIERQQGLEVRLLDRGELLALAPYLAPDSIGGTYCPIEGKANPLMAAFAFARAAQRHGARILGRTRTIGMTRDGDAWLVATDAGVVRARRVVNCAGAAAGEVASWLGLDLAVEAHPIQVTVTERVAPLVPHLVYSAADRLSLKQTAQGSVIIGGGWPARLHPVTGLPVVSEESLIPNLRLAIAAVPAVARMRVVRSWAAIVNGTQDWRPILGELPGAAGVFLCFFPWMGFTAGPHVARVIAELALGRRRADDPEIAGFAPGALA